MFDFKNTHVYQILFQLALKTRSDYSALLTSQDGTGTLGVVR